jgi:hypothetical protein
VGRRARLASHVRADLPRPDGCHLPRSLGCRCDDGRRQSRLRPRPVPAGDRPDVVPRRRRCRSQPRGVRHGRRHRDGDVLQRNRRRERPHPPRRLPRGVPGFARRVGRGVLPARTRSDGAAGRRYPLGTCGRSGCTSPAPRRSRRTSTARCRVFRRSPKTPTARAPRTTSLPAWTMQAPLLSSPEASNGPVSRPLWTCALVSRWYAATAPLRVGCSH